MAPTFKDGVEIASIDLEVHHFVIALHLGDENCPRIACQLPKDWCDRMAAGTVDRDRFLALGRMAIEQIIQHMEDNREGS